MKKKQIKFEFVGNDGLGVESENMSHKDLVLVMIAIAHRLKADSIVDPDTFYESLFAAIKNNDGKGYIIFEDD